MRFYSTIGIQNVFLSPISEEQLPQSYLASPPPSASFTTPEIIGTIKAEPDDFCVRELASEKLKLPAEWKVAQLRDVVVESDSKNTFVDQTVKTLPVKDEKPRDVLDVEKELDPLEVVRRVLQSQHVETWSDELAALQNLQDQALIALKAQTTNECVVWFPPLSVDSSCLSEVVQRSGDRGSLHRCLKVAFPLLKSETIKREDDDPLIKVTVDSSFFALFPSVYEPAEETIQALYKFRKQGVPVAVGLQNKKRKRDRSSYSEDDPFSFLLPLRPGISKDDRRKIHHVISSQSRDFETSTISDFKAPDGTTTVALLLKWSQAALRNASSFGGGKSKTCLLFVLKKRQKEHLAAILTLTRVLRCRQSDIGTAGIKDMHAVTYQFCTIRGQEPKRLMQANAALQHHGLEIGSVQPVDFSLQPGELDGNRFVIVVKDPKRIQVKVNNGRIEEERCPCDAEDRKHILARADAVRKFGFVNFYGEQRLGIAGEPEVVGVRSFDIGRAMLQKDFDKAVDLLMTGRLICRGLDGQENPQARACRQIWKDTGGNPEETSKALPKGDSMTRERTVLQGLKRYQNSLEALKCLHFRVRTFWIHAYQSYVWNKMASERLELYGQKAVVGDLIVGDDDKVLVVTSDMVSTTSLYQVVLPLPGYHIQYPTNGMGQRYEQLLQNENVKFEKEAPLEATAKGSYRRLVVPMNSLEVEFPDVASTDEVNSFQISFDLPSGSYATMLLRELMVTTVTRV